MNTHDWKLIEVENPELVITAVERLDEGWSCLGYLVNKTKVFKVPKLDCWDELAVEIMFLDRLGEELPRAVPHPLLHQRDSKATPFGYAVYSYLPGIALDTDLVSTPKLQIILENMALFLRTLHNISPPPELIDLIYHEDHNELAKTTRRLFTAAETEIRPAISSQQWGSLESIFEEQLDHCAHDFSPSLIHRDLCPGNVRIVNDEITGVFDFGNMVLGDPDLDFCAIYEDIGEATLVEIARHYGHPRPGALLEKMARLRVINTVEVIIDDAEYAPEGVVEQCWSDLRTQLQMT
ncbi:MAG: aminoglycoside phosphotransferase family protein [Chloroflexota bacterium]